MEITMAQSALRSASYKTEPALFSIFHKAETEYRQIEQMFLMLGWGRLPAELKLVIEDDVKGYIDELHGSYCTSCPLVQLRRERVDFWVNSYIDGVCTLDTAVDALKVKRL
jgi:hypothetical protein